MMSILLFGRLRSSYSQTTNACGTPSYPHYRELLKYDGINFPINLKDNSLFEKMNNIFVNMLILKKTELYQFV